MKKVRKVEIVEVVNGWVVWVDNNRQWVFTNTDKLAAFVKKAFEEGV